MILVPLPSQADAEQMVRAARRAGFYRRRARSSPRLCSPVPARRSVRRLSAPRASVWTSSPRSRRVSRVTALGCMSRAAPRAARDPPLARDPRRAQRRSFRSRLRRGCRGGAIRAWARARRGNALACAARRGAWPVSGHYKYIHDGAAIYARSFAIIRAEANLARFSPEKRNASRCGSSTPAAWWRSLTTSSSRPARRKRRGTRSSRARRSSATPIWSRRA